MRADDSAHGVPIAPRAPAPLRVWEPPPVYRQLPLPLGPAEEPPRPEEARLRIDGYPFVLRYWSAGRWARTPEAIRPRAAIRGDGGGWFSIEAEEV